MAPISLVRLPRFWITFSAVSVASRMAFIPSIVWRTFSWPFSALFTTSWLSPAVCSALASTSRIELTISSMLVEVSTAARESSSVFSDTCFTLATICSMELETSLTFVDSTEAVSLSSSPAAPSSRIVLDDSSTETFNAWEESAMSFTCRSIASIERAASRMPVTWEAVTVATLSAIEVISPAVASTRSAAEATRLTVDRSDWVIFSKERERSPSSSSDSKTRP